MLSFTKQEKTVLLFLAGVIFIGSFLGFLFKKYPKLETFVNRFENDEHYYQVDINSASLQELIDIPYIGPYTAGQIVAYRQDNAGIRSLSELKTVRGIKEKNYLKFSKYLKVGGVHAKDSP